MDLRPESMALGTYIGGWRIIQTLGRKMVRLRPVHGFAAETTAATVLLVTGRLGMPSPPPTPSRPPSWASAAPAVSAP